MNTPVQQNLKPRPIQSQVQAKPKSKYRILGGKHFGPKGQLMGRKGDIIELEDEVADKFRNKFEKVTDEETE